MSNQVSLYLSHELYQRILDHLLSDAASEQAAFGYAQSRATDIGHRFDLVEWHPITSEGFANQSGYYMELTDAARASAIKRAHDLRTSLVEFHSHLGPWPAAFSASDWSGFDEFVPHVWWRLKGRPYAAIVVASSGFDGIAWIAAPDRPQRLTNIVAGSATILATANSILPTVSP